MVLIRLRNYSKIENSRKYIGKKMSEYKIISKKVNYISAGAIQYHSFRKVLSLKQFFSSFYYFFAL
jgi:enoyl-[acyl-carrier-protein] reductase (NADH)